MLEVILGLLLGGLFGCGVIAGMDALMDWIAKLRAQKRTRIERSLDCTQEELRQTILALAGQLGADAHEARKALIRESFFASGHVPTRD